MTDYGVILGGAGLVASLGTLLYSQGQLSTMKRQADEARRASLLESSREMLGRYQELRTRWLTNPAGVEGLKSTLPGLADTVAIAGGMELYLLYRDMLDTFQDVFFLRKEGVVGDGQWHMWTTNHMRSPVRAPGYAKIFRFAADNGLLHPEFVAFYEPTFKGGTLGDPAPVAA